MRACVRAEPRAIARSRLYYAARGGQAWVLGMVCVTRPDAGVQDEDEGSGGEDGGGKHGECYWGCCSIRCCEFVVIRTRIQ